MKKIILILAVLFTCLTTFSQKMVIQVEKQGMSVELTNGFVLTDSIFIYVTNLDIDPSKHIEDSMGVTLNFKIFQSKKQLKNFGSVNNVSEVLSSKYRYTIEETTALFPGCFVDFRDYLKTKLSEYNVGNSDISDISDEF